jgi:citronellol/citronellal dehydrogenase
MGRLEGRVALVTGAANGLGRTVAERFAAEGASVACADLQLGDASALGRDVLVAAPVQAPREYGATLSEVVAGIRSAGGTAVGIQCDIADEASCDQLLWNARRLLGPPDILVNVAVLTYFLPLLEFPTAWWERMFAVNVQAVFMLCKKVLPAMIAKRAGAIVNITSEAAVGPGCGPYAPRPQSRTVIGPPTVYGATKAAVERFTQGLAEEVYPHGVAVSAIAPSNTVLVTPGAEYLRIRHPDSEPPEHMAQAIMLLVTEPLDAVSGRVAYSQALLAEYGLLDDPRGVGSDYPGTGYSQR